MAKLRHYSTDQCAAAAVPFQIDRAVQIARAMDFCPAVRTARLFRPGFDKAEFLFQLRISRYLAAQRSAAGRNDLNHRLHPLVRFDSYAGFATMLCKGGSSAPPLDDKRGGEAA